MVIDFYIEKWSAWGWGIQEEERVRETIYSLYRISIFSRSIQQGRFSVSMFNIQVWINARRGQFEGYYNS